MPPTGTYLKGFWYLYLLGGSRAEDAGRCVRCVCRVLQGSPFTSFTYTEQLHLLDFTFIIYSFISTGWLDL